MLKIFLKHWIYERCINVMFYAINRNFSRIKGACRVGQKFHYLHYFTNEFGIERYYKMFNGTIVNQIGYAFVVDAHGAKKYSEPDPVPEIISDIKGFELFEDNIIDVDWKND